MPEDLTGGEQQRDIFTYSSIYNQDVMPDESSQTAHDIDNFLNDFLKIKQVCLNEAIDSINKMESSSQVLQCFQQRQKSQSLLFTQSKLMQASDLPLRLRRKA